MLTVACRSPKPIVGVRIPGGMPNNCDCDEIGIHDRLKICWIVISVRVQLPPQVQHYRSLKIKEKINMDILSFILGMSVVVVIAVAVVAVMAFVKVKKHNK